MNIISISQRVPMNSGKGDQHLTFHRIKALISHGNHVHAIFFKGKGSSYLSAIRKLEELGVEVHPVIFSYRHAIINLIRNFFDRKIPYQCLIYTSEIYKKKLKELVKAKSPCIVYCSFIRVLLNAEGFSKICYLDMIDSLSLNYSRKLPNLSFLIRKIYTEEFLRLVIFEKTIFKYAQKVSLVSKLDKDWIGKDEIQVIPLGVDANKFKPSELKHQMLSILFSGNIDYYPNAEAIRWFLDFCWQDIVVLNPNAQLIIAGRGKNPDISKYANKCNVIFTGEVSSMADIIKMGDIAIAPMKSGAGMQNKILEAMSCGLPVIATNLGIGDICVTDGLNIVLAETSQQFISAIDILLKNKNKRNQIGFFAREFIENNYSWDTSNAKFIQNFFHNWEFK